MTNLRNIIAQHNEQQAASGSPYYFREQGRNGYQAVDLYRVTPEGTHSCQSVLEAGSSRECVNAIRMAHYEGYTYPQAAKQLTRKQAKAMLEVVGVDFSLDFYQQSLNTADLLTTWAKATRYRKPFNANGSLARYFYANLLKVTL